VLQPSIGKSLGDALSVEELSKYLGLATPVLYAAATYKFFDFIDARASDAAQSAISHWIQSLRHSRNSIGSALHEIFRRIYGSSLLSFRTFGRVAILSLVIQFVMICELDPSMFRSAARYPVVSFGCGIQIFTNVLCDYVSILFIGKWIDFVGERPLFALFTGLLVGIGIIRLLYVFLGIFYLTDFRANVNTGGDQALGWIVLYRMPSPEISLAAYAIHLWLPLFATALFLAKLAAWFARAIQGAQSFLGEGQKHPLKAVGLIATAIVFILAIMVRWLFGAT
jgi:hypothetical protein